MKHIFTATAVLFFGVAFSQKADDSGDLQDLEKVIIQGNRLEIPFDQSARDIQIITQQEISHLPGQSVNELLTYIGGIDIRQRGPFGGQTDVSIDGGTSEQTLVLLNGVKLIDDQTAHLMMNIPVPVESIDHIEILRGAAARVYGINALTGAINIVTKKEANSFLSAKLFAGSSFQHKDKGDGNGIYGGGGIELTGNYGDAKQNHLFAVAQDIYNGQRYNTALNNSRFFYNGSYHLDDKNTVQALAGHIDNHFGANGFYAAPGDKNSEEIVQTSIFSISSKHKLGQFTLMPRISDRYNEDDYRFFKNNLNKAHSLHYTNALTFELNGSLSTKIGQFGLGWESRFSKISSSNIGKHHRDNHGVYAEYKAKYWRKLITNIGVYANYNTHYGWQAYPGIDLAYRLNDHWKISTSMGSAQRIPSFTDLYLDQPPGNVGNPNVQPENAWEYEAAVHYSSNPFTAKIGYFYRDISRFIDWVRTADNQPYIPYNLGHQKIHGIYSRIEQRFKLSEGHQLGYRISYNYLKPRMQTPSEKQSKYTLETLKHQFIVGLHYTYHDFFIQLENRYIKRALNTGYDLLDARLAYQLKDFSLYTNITNILNATYIEAGAVPMPSRWFTIGVKYTWNSGE